MMKKTITLTPNQEENIEHLYNIVSTVARHRRKPKDYLLDHSIWYGGVSGLNIKTGGTSIKAMSADDSKCTDDHVYAPQMFAPYVYENIKDISFNEFRDIVIECGTTIRVTKAENTTLSKQNGILLRDKYREAGIKILWTDGLVYDNLPFSISETLEKMEKYYYDTVTQDPFDKI